MPNSERLFEKALKLIPGGVNSPVRSGQAVKATPKFVARAEGARLWDVDGRDYLDLVSSWGPLILGHARAEVVEAIKLAAEKGTSYGAPHEAEITLAALINHHLPQLDQVRLVNSGTEATMTALRLARGVTGRDKILKFSGGYHGHSDGLLVAAGSGLATFGQPASLGVPPSLAALTLVAPYNDPASLKTIFDQVGPDIAAVIVEPIAGNMGLVLPKPEFLEALKTLPKQYGALLIVDEVITGFRVGLGGAQTLYALQPDLTCLGKIIGGGLPLAALGGHQKFMSQLAPEGKVYQAGTLSGNPLAVAAGIATLKILEQNPAIYDQLAALAQTLAEGLASLAQKKGLPHTINRLGSMFTLFFAPEPVYDWNSAQKCDQEIFGAYWRAMTASGLWLPPSQFETNFLSAAYTEATVTEALERAEAGFKKM